MAGARVLHARPLDDFVGLFIDHEAVIGVNALDVVLPLFSSDDENFVLGLN